MHKLANCVALVTGGACGIGRALCEQLATDGAYVLVTDINIGKAEEVAAAIRQHGGCAEAVLLDVSNEAEVRRVVVLVLVVRRGSNHAAHAATVALAVSLHGPIAPRRVTQRAR